jgi:hypothetical protein
MRCRNISVAVTVLLLGLPLAFAASSVEKIRNAKVVVTEVTLAPGESEAAPDAHPNMLVYISAGTVLHGTVRNERLPRPVDEGEIAFFDAGEQPVQDAGPMPLHFVRIDFLTAGSPETWGKTGLPPAYLMLAENEYARAYDIRILSHTFEPQHTHHDRVVVSLRRGTGAYPARRNAPAFHAEYRGDCLAPGRDTRWTQPGDHRSVGHRRRAEVVLRGKSGRILRCSNATSNGFVSNE